jgi:GNAT superfamily N-acetyltransferase
VAAKKSPGRPRSESAPASSASPAVRTATLADAKAIANLVTALGYPTNTADMKRRLGALFADENYATFVAELDGAVQGMAGACQALFYEKNGVYVRLVALVTSEESSGRGIGAALVKEVERWGRARHAVEIFINSGIQRESARRFYERLGYRVTGVRFSKELE